MFPVLTRPARLTALATVAASLGLPAHAQEAAQVVVTGSVAPRPADQLPFAVGVVEREAVRSAGPQINLSESLAQVPGVVANLRHNYAQDLQISSRGFGEIGRAHV